MPRQWSDLENSHHSLWGHAAEDCGAEVCCLHTRTDHAMRGFPQYYRYDRALMERTCPHGVGHPDPDQFGHLLTRMSEEDARAEFVHGCDGCCAGALTPEMQWAPPPAPKPLVTVAEIRAYMADIREAIEAAKHPDQWVLFVPEAQVDELVERLHAEGLNNARVSPLRPPMGTGTAAQCIAINASELDRQLANPFGIPRR